MLWESTGKNINQRESIDKKVVGEPYRKISKPKSTQNKLFGYYLSGGKKTTSFSGGVEKEIQSVEECHPTTTISVTLISVFN